MEKKETPAPYCHGEPMEPTYTYKSNGVLYREWACQLHKCSNRETLPLYEEEVK